MRMSLPAMAAGHRSNSRTHSPTSSHCWKPVRDHCYAPCARWVVGARVLSCARAPNAVWPFHSSRPESGAEQHPPAMAARHPAIPQRPAGGRARRLWRRRAQVRVRTSDSPRFRTRADPWRPRPTAALLPCGCGSRHVLGCVQTIVQSLSDEDINTLLLRNLETPFLPPVVKVLLQYRLRLAEQYILAQNALLQQIGMPCRRPPRPGPSLSSRPRGRRPLPLACQRRPTRRGRPARRRPAPCHRRCLGGARSTGRPTASCSTRARHPRPARAAAAPAPTAAGGLRPRAPAPAAAASSVSSRSLTRASRPSRRVPPPNPGRPARSAGAAAAPARFHPRAPRRSRPPPRRGRPAARPRGAPRRGPWRRWTCPSS